MLLLHCLNPATTCPPPLPKPLNPPQNPQQATGDTAYKASVQEFVNNWLTSTSTPADEEAVGIFYTPKGLAKAQPGGTLQHTANAAFLVMAAADSGAWRSNQFMRQACWVRNQIGYMLVSVMRCGRG